MKVATVARNTLWAAGLGLLATLLAAPITVHVVGPAVLWVVKEPDGTIWNPFIGGISLTLAGALLVLALGRVVELPPRLAAVGIGGMGTFWMTLLALILGGFAEVVTVGLPFRLAFAGAAGVVAGRVARMGYKPPPKSTEITAATETTTPTPTATSTGTPTEPSGSTEKPA